jgi:hypothetical protein
LVACGPLLPRANAAACPQLAKADFASFRPMHVDSEPSQAATAGRALALRYMLSPARASFRCSNLIYRKTYKAAAV